MLQRSSEEKESEGASMVAWRSGDGGGALPPAAKSPASFEDSFARSISFSSIYLLSQTACNLLQKIFRSSLL